MFVLPDWCFCCPELDPTQPVAEPEFRQGGARPGAAGQGQLLARGAPVRGAAGGAGLLQEAAPRRTRRGQETGRTRRRTQVATEKQAVTTSDRFTVYVPEHIQDSLYVRSYHD